MTDPIDAAAARIATHVREMRRRYPDALGRMKRFATMRGQDPLPEWPDWCWVPMSGAEATTTDRRTDPADIARVAAVAQWKLTGRHIVLPSPEVAAEGVVAQLPAGAPLEDMVKHMNTVIPREAIMEALAGECYYLVNPVEKPADLEAPIWVYGCYVHLEWDVHDGRTELRFVADTGDWNGLLQSAVHIDQPTIDWATTSAENAMLKGGAGPMARSLAEWFRVVSWSVWPFLATLMDKRAFLVGPRVLDDPALDAMARGAQAWELTYKRPVGGRLRPV